MNAILLLSALSILTLFAGAFNMKKLALPLIFVGLLGAFVLNLGEWEIADNFFYNKMLLFDHYAVAFSGLLIILTLFIFFLCHQYYKKENADIVDIYGLLIFVLIGGIIMASYANLTMLFIGIEILSISLYILAGSRRLSLRSNEASIKYFLMGSFATGFLLFGIALVYGETHTFHLDVIRQYVIAQNGNLSLKFTTGIVMMLIGLSFKVSVFPFHFWAPDVYEGSPTLVTTFMATVVKTAGFAALYRLFVTCFDNTPLPDAWLNIIWGMTALTITVGNFSALYQKGAKRMLAFSSVSNAGYLMIGVLAMNHAFSANAIFYYTAVYSLATIAAFGVLMLVDASFFIANAMKFTEGGYVPLLLAGDHADAALAALGAAGFANIRAVGHEVGRASAIKMIRSVMVKGIEALTAEMMLAATRAGVAEDVLASLDASERPQSWFARAAYNIERMATHGIRRAAEMEESARTLAALGVEPLMTNGTVRRQREQAGHPIVTPTGHRS